MFSIGKFLGITVPCVIKKESGILVFSVLDERLKCILELILCQVCFEGDVEAVCFECLGDFLHVASCTGQRVPAVSVISVSDDERVRGFIEFDVFTGVCSDTDFHAAAGLREQVWCADENDGTTKDDGNKGDEEGFHGGINVNMLRLKKQGYFHYNQKNVPCARRARACPSPCSVLSSSVRVGRGPVPRHAAG